MGVCHNYKGARFIHRTSPVVFSAPLPHAINPKKQPDNADFIDIFIYSTDKPLLRPLKRGTRGKI